jgi:nucleotide-binding universal stress UspA family protein
MKTILVPTDFSDVSQNAINYASELGKFMNAKIILFHVYSFPIITNEALMMLGFEEIEKDCLTELKNIETKIHMQYGESLSVECVCKCGIPVDEINLYSSNHKVDLIVMGMQGAGYLTEKIIGSSTTSLIHQSTCPVLVINKEVKYRNIKKITFACDYAEIENNNILKSMIELARIFKSHIYVLNVSESDSFVEPKIEISDFMKLEESLDKIDHTFYYLNDENVVEGVNNFVKEKDMDMVVMIPHKHSILKNIFQESNTKRMAFHSKVPLLA